MSFIIITHSKTSKKRNQKNKIEKQVAVAQQAAKEIAGYRKAPLNITITGRKLSGLPLNLTGRKLSGLPLNLTGRKLSGLPLNLTGRKLSGLPLNLTGRKLMTGINGNSSLIKLAPINVTYLHKAMKYPAPQASSSMG